MYQVKNVLNYVSPQVHDITTESSAQIHNKHNYVAFKRLNNFIKLLGLLWKILSVSNASTTNDILGGY